jgi:hypothetical protein
MIPVYRAGRQLIKVRALMVLSLVLLPLSLWCGLDIARTHGLREADGGILAPLPERLAFGGLVAALGVGFVIGMGLYGRHYAARIELDPDNKQIQLDTIGFFGNVRRIINVADLGNVRAHHDDNWDFVIAAMAAGHPTVPVHVPWLSLRITEWRWPLILDQQGVVLHHKLMRILLGVWRA